ncbi:marvel domain-containing protein [Nemania sp. FL0916]|nr:marvel domain-containing protein [Nemania sp. FL0916]
MRTLLNSILRIAQFLLVLIATALIGNVRASSAHDAAPINFAIFVCALSWIAVLYSLIANFVSALAIPIVALALDGLATLFTFIGAVVLSAKLTSVNCDNWESKPPSWIAFGSEKRCREIQAGLVFMWFLFATFAAAVVFTFREFRRNGGSVRGPSMSQISA